MMKLLGSLVLAGICAGCVSQARPRTPDAPDPIVGDLKCVTAPLSILDALYLDPTKTPARDSCEQS